MGLTWFRQGEETSRSMPQMVKPALSRDQTITANNDYAMAA